MKNLHEQLGQLASLCSENPDQVHEILLIGAEMALRRVEVVMLSNHLRRLESHELGALFEELKPREVIVSRPPATDTEPAP